MATLSYVTDRRKWRVRWCATNHRATHNRIFSGSKYFFEKADAVGFYAEIEKQERFWRKGQVPNRTIEQVLEDFTRYAQRFTKRTWGHYKTVLKSFIETLPDNVIWIQQIKPDHIREYLSRMLDRELQNRTCNSHLTVIKSFCRYLHENYDLPNAAAKIRMFKEEPSTARFLSQAEYEKIIEIAPQQARDRIEFLANTGLRASEFAALKSDCINEDMTAITITGKGRKRRTIPLNEIAREIWPRLQTGTKNALWLQFSRLAKKAEIPKFGPHALRHYFATQLLLAGVPMIKVSMIMGHAAVTTTQACYSHILPEDLQGITDSLVKKPMDQTNEHEQTFPIVLHRKYRSEIPIVAFKRA